MACTWMRDPPLSSHQFLPMQSARNWKAISDLSRSRKLAPIRMTTALSSFFRPRFYVGLMAYTRESSSQVALQLAFSPMLFFAIGLEYALDVPIECAQHPDASMHQEIAALDGAEQTTDRGLPRLEFGLRQLYDVVGGGPSPSIISISASCMCRIICPRSRRSNHSPQPGQFMK